MKIKRRGGNKSWRTHGMLMYMRAGELVKPIEKKKPRDLFVIPL